MPLILLGLLLLIGVLAYSVLKYMNSVQVDNRPVRERYPHAFPVYPPEDKKDGDEEEHEEPPIDAESYYDEDSFRGDLDYMIRNIKKDLKDRAAAINLDLDSIRKKFGNEDDEPEDDGDNTVEFPKENVETEKKKRGIHTD